MIDLRCFPSESFHFEGKLVGPTFCFGEDDGL